MSQDNKKKGLRLEDINNHWAGDAYKVDRECLLYRLARLEQYGSEKYSNCGNCKLCNRVWCTDLAHYIEFHGHQPTSDEIQAIHAKFDDWMIKQEYTVQEGMFLVARRAQK